MHVYAQCLACDILAVHLSCVRRTCTCTEFGGASIARECARVACILYVYMYSVRHGQFERCALFTGARMLGRAHCTCMCTVFGMDSLSDAPIMCRPTCVGGKRSVHKCL